MDGWIDGWLAGWLARWINGWPYGWTNKPKNWFPAVPDQQNRWKSTGQESMFSLELESDACKPYAPSGENKVR